MQSPTVRTATPADEVPAIDIVVLAFAADPVARRCWPGSHQYLTSMPSFTRAFGGGAFVHDGAHCTNDLSGAALMTYALQQCDREHSPAYLESTNPRNISLYQRYGFEILGTIKVGALPSPVSAWLLQAAVLGASAVLALLAAS